ncbi:zinc ribbon domain-containing protein [Streptomyces sp. NPDC087425]
MCGRCGTLMSGTAKGTGPVYQCNRRGRNDEKKCTRSITALTLEDFVVDAAVEPLGKLRVDGRLASSNLSESVTEELEDDQRARRRRDGWRQPRRRSTAHPTHAPCRRPCAGRGKLPSPHPRGRTDGQAWAWLTPPRSWRAAPSLTGKQRRSRRSENRSGSCTLRGLRGRLIFSQRPLLARRNVSRGFLMGGRPPRARPRGVASPLRLERIAHDGK